MKKYAYIAAGAFSLLIAGCADNSDSPDASKPTICPPDPIELHRPSYDYADAKPLQEVAAENTIRANCFAANLFRTLYEDKDYKDNKGNVCVSPANVFCTFAMMANGDDGECRDEILTMLGYGNGADALHDLNVYANALLRETSMFDGATQCGFTNSIWHRPGINIYPDFSKDIEDIFGGLIFPIWIGDEAGMAAINSFVCGQTCGMIYPFLENPLPVDLAILNTTYFKGAWETAFVKEATEDGVFHNLDGSKSSTPFMKTLENSFDYAEADGIRCLRLPYKGEHYSMTILQPLADTEKGFDGFLKTLDGDAIASYENILQRQAVILQMPKFETEVNENILGPLKRLGIDITCSSGLNKVADMVLPLALFQHAVRIIVDEEGTEGGAASLGGMLGSSGAEYTPKRIKIDSPFVYVIRDVQSGTVLFMGAVNAL